MARGKYSKKQLAAIHAKGNKGGSNGTNLPPHLSALTDTPEKRVRADNIMAEGRFKEREKMEGKGYVLKGDQWVHQPPIKRPNPTDTAYPIMIKVLGKYNKSAAINAPNMSEAKKWAKQNGYNPDKIDLISTQMRLVIYGNKDKVYLLTK